MKMRVIIKKIVTIICDLGPLKKGWKAHKQNPWEHFNTRNSEVCPLGTAHTLRVILFVK